MQLTVDPHPFENWHAAYDYTKAADAAVLVEVLGVLAIISPLGGYQDLKDVQGVRSSTPYDHPQDVHQEESS